MSINNIGKIGVVCYYPFPEGMAPTIRIISYCIGLQKNGVETEVFSYKGVSRHDQEPMSGYARGVKYTISHKWAKEYGRVYKVLFGHWVVFFKTLRNIRNSSKKRKFDYIFLSLDDPAHLLGLAFSLWIMGIKTVFIGDEFPEPVRRLKSTIPLSYIIAYKVAYLFIRKRILMTSALKDFYNETVCPKPTFLLNSVIDTTRFENVEKVESKGKYLCYMGNMQLAKDNVDNIIRAFSIIKNDFPELELRLYGQPSDLDKKVIERVMGECQCSDRVKLMGRIPYSTVPAVLAGAAVLVSSQPDTKRAQGGFPTKLAEYMMMHVPIVLTDVGEISSYVSDGETAYLVKPDDPAAYAEKLTYVLRHYDEAMSVAESAFDVADKNWGAEKVTAPLVSFLFQ